MTDRPSFSDIHDNNSPQQLQLRLNGLYELLPSRKTRGFDWNTLKRTGPLNSELKAQVLTQLDEILRYAQITDAFRDYIFFNFVESFTYGILKEDHVVDDFQVALWGRRTNDTVHRGFLYEQIVQSSTATGGIFSADEAKEVERLAYQRTFQGRLAVNRLMQRWHSNMGYEGDYRPSPRDSGVVRLRNWRQQFIERYQDEP